MISIPPIPYHKTEALCLWSWKVLPIWNDKSMLYDRWWQMMICERYFDYHSKTTTRLLPNVCLLSLGWEDQIYIINIGFFLYKLKVYTLPFCKLLCTLTITYYIQAVSRSDCFSCDKFTLFIYRNFSEGTELVLRNSKAKSTWAELPYDFENHLQTLVHSTLVLFMYAWQRAVCISMELVGCC